VSRPTIFALALVAASALIPATSVSDDLPTTAAPNTVSPSASATISHLSNMELPRLGQALRATHSAKVLAIGSSSTAGVGASSPSHTYVARLEINLESTLKGADFEVIGHGLSGEVAQGAADRMKREVEQVKPDLVIWQVGTNDALRHVAMDSFKECLKKTLAWLKQQQIDVILINPQYGESLVKDGYYEEVVAAVAAIALEEQVLIVDRFDALRKLHRQRGDQAYLSADNLHMNDEGYRWLAERLTATILKALPQGPGNVDQRRTATRSST
jgi:acyl-CoA thioesterase I